MSTSPELATAAEGAPRIILVHGTGHGGWCWYRVATLLRAAGHRVDAPDLAASGIDPRQLRDVPTFEDYTRPLLDALRALPPGERAVLVGHSFGGMSIALAAEMFPEKVAAAVFVTAFLPDCTNPRSHVIEKVWSLVRRFDQPQLFKPFVSRCEMKGNIEIGSVREVNVKSGLPATRSTERLELLDDNEHILSVRFVGGDHRLQNYSSILTVHPEVIDGRPGTLVIESFVVDVPEGNTKDETCYFVEALLKCNLKSLAEVSERQVIKDQTEPLDR